jgi:hypothetical protein
VARDWWKRLPPDEQAEYRRSEGIGDVKLAPHPGFARVIDAMVQFLGDEDRGEVQRVSNALVRGISKGLGMCRATVRVAAGRPHDQGGELHGLYEPAEAGDLAHITVWMRTAKRDVPVAPRTFLRTLLHEVVHHIDMELLDLPNSWHSKGFYRRESSLYRVVTRGTDLAQRARGARAAPPAPPRACDPGAPPSQAAVDGLAMLRAVAEEIRAKRGGVAAGVSTASPGVPDRRGDSGGAREPDPAGRLPELRPGNGAGRFKQ